MPNDKPDPTYRGDALEAYSDGRADGSFGVNQRQERYSGNDDTKAAYQAGVRKGKLEKHS